MNRRVGRLSVLGGVVLLAISGCGSGSQSEVGLRVETQDAIWGCIYNAPSPGIDLVPPGTTAHERQCRHALSLFTSDFTRMGSPLGELDELGKQLLAMVYDRTIENTINLRTAMKAAVEGK